MEDALSRSAPYATQASGHVEPHEIGYATAKTDYYDSWELDLCETDYYDSHLDSGIDWLL